MQFPIRMVWVPVGIATMAVLLGCSEDPNPVSSPTEPTQQNPPDPSEAIQKRIEGKTREALAILRQMNEDYPDSPEILTLLGHTLLDAEEYDLAAFRLQQAADLGGTADTLAEAAQAHVLAGDDASAEKLYRSYLKEKPGDTFAHIKFARVLHRLGKQSEALEAFQRVPEKANAKDALALAHLFLSKGIYKQAEHWFRMAEEKEPRVSAAPYLGLLEVSIKLKDEASTESFALALEKTHPGSLDSSHQANAVANLLIARRGLDFFQRGIPTEGKTASELAAALLNSILAQEPVVGGSKLPSRGEDEPVVEEANATDSALPEEPAFAQAKPPSLADIFSTPPQGSDQVERSFLDQAELAMVEKNYRSALLFTRRALRENPETAAAWHLASQAHFLLGETDEAEMKALEATRHAPNDLGYHMDYLRIARETLRDRRYLEELEKAHERFPESIEILWQLARRYHVAENKPATAAILYRKLLALAPLDNPLRPEAERELRTLGQGQ